MKAKYYWIKERHNPQLGTYYTAYGRLPFKEAMAHEKSIYGSNTMHKYATEDEYLNALVALRDRGERVH